MSIHSWSINSTNLYQVMLCNDQYAPGVWYISLSLSIITNTRPHTSSHEILIVCRRLAFPTRSTPLPIKEKTTLKVLMTCTCTMRPESGLDCLMCAKSARQRCGREMEGRDGCGPLATSLSRQGIRSYLVVRVSLTAAAGRGRGTCTAAMLTVCRRLGFPNRSCTCTVGPSKYA